MTTTCLPARTIRSGGGLSRLLPTLLLLLTVFGPISMDLYLPALPALTTELGAVTSVAQLTVTACLIGLALGQLIAGPVSDQFGRRRVLLAGVVAYVLTSALCAASPSIEALVAARFVQGLAGGVGIVIGQAAGRDVFSGTQLIRFYGRLTVFGGLAAVIGPLLGGQLNTFLDWRGLFAFLALVGAILLAVTARRFSETLPASRRTSGGFTRTDPRLPGTSRRPTVPRRGPQPRIPVRGPVRLPVRRDLRAARDLRTLPQAYAAAFGLNSAGFMTAGFVAGRAAERWSVPGTLAVGIVVTGAGALGLLITGFIGAPLPVVIVSLLALASGVAISSPPATTLALADWPRMAGTASSLLGMVRFGFGAISAPLVGVAGADTVLPLGAVTTVCVVLAATAYAGLVRTERPYCRAG